MNPCPTDLLQYCETVLPFPVFRHILEYTGRLRSFSKKAQQSLQSHFEHRICHKCGEYLDFPMKRLKTLNKKRRARHLACKQPKFIKESIFKYHRMDVYITDILDIHFLESLPYSGIAPTKCPILIRMKKARPKFWSDMVFKENRSMIFKTLFYPMEIRDQSFGDIMTLQYEDFIVLPELFFGANDQILYNLQNIRNDELIYNDFNYNYNFKSHPIVNILVFIFQNITNLTYNPEYCQVMEELIRTIPIKYSNVKLQLLKKLNLNHVAILNHKWMKEILLEFPELLENMKDDIITDFFTHNRNWFLSVLCLKRPITFKYISFYYKDGFQE